MENTNMSLSDANAINRLLGFTSDDERDEFAAERLQLDILHVVSIEMQRKGLTRSELAARVGVSRSYISQLFAGDTPLNLRTLVKIERVLGTRFKVSMETTSQRSDLTTGFATGDPGEYENIIPFLSGGSTFRRQQMDVFDSVLPHQEVC
jgi:transcriptional regulator with XRE-family HTH domain